MRESQSACKRRRNATWTVSCPSFDEFWVLPLVEWVSELHNTAQYYRLRKDCHLCVLKTGKHNIPYGTKHTIGHQAMEEETRQNNRPEEKYTMTASYSPYVTHICNTWYSSTVGVRILRFNGLQFQVLVFHIQILTINDLDQCVVHNSILWPRLPAVEMALTEYWQSEDYSHRDIVASTSLTC